MNQKIDVYYRNRSGVWKVMVAIAFAGLFQVAQAGVGAKTELSQDQDRSETRGGFTQEEMNVKALPSQRRIDFQLGEQAYRDRDYQVALRKFMPLAKAGDMHAQYYIGLMYANGYGLPQDPAKAEEWFKRFSNQLGAGAKFNLGVIYYKGERVPQDYQKALAWFKRAAEEGDMKAQFNLGFIYDNGYGVPQDRAEAIWWYQKAANQGLLKAQKALGVMYSEGQGVAKDYVQAYFWFNVAAEQGDESAASVRDALAKDMTTSQIAEAIRLAHEWQLTSEHAGQGH